MDITSLGENFWWYIALFVALAWVPLAVAVNSWLDKDP